MDTQKSSSLNMAIRNFQLIFPSLPRPNLSQQPASFLDSLEVLNILFRISHLQYLYLHRLTFKQLSPQWGPSWTSRSSSTKILCYLKQMSRWYFSMNSATMNSALLVCWVESWLVSQQRTTRRFLLWRISGTGRVRSRTRMS